MVSRTGRVWCSRIRPRQSPRDYADVESSRRRRPPGDPARVRLRCSRRRRHRTYTLPNAIERIDRRGSTRSQARDGMNVGHRVRGATYHGSIMEGNASAFCSPARSSSRVHSHPRCRRHADARRATGDASSLANCPALAPSLFSSYCHRVTSSRGNVKLPPLASYPCARFQCPIAWEPGIHRS